MQREKPQVHLFGEGLERGAPAPVLNLGGMALLLGDEQHAPPDEGEHGDLAGPPRRAVERQQRAGQLVLAQAAPSAAKRREGNLAGDAAAGLAEDALTVDAVEQRHALRLLTGAGPTAPGRRLQLGEDLLQPFLWRERRRRRSCAQATRQAAALAT